MKKVILIILLVLATALETTSCDYKPIENIPMVIGLAVDPIEDGYRLTAKVVIPAGSSNDGSISEEIFIQSSGKTMFDAVRDFIMKEGQKVFWGQLEFMVINETIAEEDITGVLDFFIRDNEVRENIWLLISDKELKAEEVLMASFSEKKLQFYISDALKNIDYVSKYSTMSLIDFSKIYSDKGKEQVLPFIKIEISLGQKRIILNGGSVFKDNKAVGRLDGKEMQRYRMLLGENAGIYVIDYKESGNESKISLEIGDTKSKVRIQKKDGKYVITVQLSIIGVIGEIEDNRVKISTKEKLEEFKKHAEIQLEEELAAFIIKIQKNFGSDIFGFGEKFKNKYPKVFKELEDNWNEVFSSLNIEVEVKVSITGTAQNKQPLYKED
ncbi:MAG: hypothetical protein CVU84_07315 [Firmicutes bacterium HGW-Firmicutes-1]|nr:MAG: hypothetical protein CVU84_07315 [Firmicutes bacterium HGW-Firmicutes-1]